MITEANARPFNELGECISKAMQKTATSNENQLCFYLPGAKGRLHHWGFKRMKQTSPQELLKLLKEYILEKETPEKISSKRRQKSTEPVVPRTVEVKFKRSQLNRIAEALKKSGDKELLALFTPFQSLSQVQKLMIDMIKEKGIDLDLWDTYTRLVQDEQGSFVQSTED